MAINTRPQTIRQASRSALATSCAAALARSHSIRRHVGALTVHLPKCHPCRSGCIVVFVEDAAQTLVSMDVDSGDLTGDRRRQWS
ncbi:hypothetical protein [Kibdelosporangium philippinense]|uniref:hypothetical protein n=1 Tax=Kibdelosporangium philippinense TaxID=211113 RepID=UPI0036101708